MKDDGIDLDTVDYTHKWEKLDYESNLEYIPLALSVSCPNIKFENGYLIGECLSEFTEECQCEICAKSKKTK